MFAEIKQGLELFKEEMKKFLKEGWDKWGNYNPEIKKEIETQSTKLNGMAYALGLSREEIAEIINKLELELENERQILKG